jgi:sulfur-oxidizing protein SoxX
MNIKAITVLAVAASGLAWNVAQADTIAPETVAYTEFGALEASLTGKPGDPEAGLQVVTDRGLGNCVACHKIAQLADVPFQGEVGPELTWTGEIRTQAELRGIVANAKQMFPGSVMPAFYKTSGFIRPGNGYTGKAAEGELEPILSAQQVEDVVAFLMTLKEE